MEAQALERSTPTRAADLLEMAKPRITLMVVITAAVGFLLAAEGPFPWAALVHTLIGTALLAGGASALNQVVERETDARMRRTANRPIPAGRVSAEQGLLLGVSLSVAGMLYTALAVNLLTALLGTFTLASYVFVYTPMKRLSSLSTIVGAVPGAVPPMMGVTGAADAVLPVAWALFGILFFWQMPHFLSIAWLYRADYERGGFPMLTVLDPSGVKTARQAVLYAAALVPVSLLPTLMGVSGPVYFVGALLLGLAYLAFSVAFGANQEVRTARRLLLASVLYLPAVLGLIVVEYALTLT